MTYHVLTHVISQDQVDLIEINNEQSVLLALIPDEYCEEGAGISTPDDADFYNIETFEVDHDFQAPATKEGLYEALKENRQLESDNIPIFKSYEELD